MLFLVPPRKTPGLTVGSEVVTLLNGIYGDVVIVGGAGITVDAPSGEVITILVTPYTYVLRSGDTVTGNLNLVPSSGSQYGLGLAALTTDPTSGIVGAMYFNTTSTTVRVFTSGGWQNFAQTGALTQATADTLYLRLDGTNTPMQGNLSMGSSIFCLGNLSTDPGSAAAGDMYFSTALHEIRWYNGSTWSTVAGDITSITAGTGLSANGTPGGTLTSSGTLAVDQGFSPTWTGVTSFTQPVNFATGQTFSISQLTGSGQATGSLIRFHGGVWATYGVGSNGQVLTVVGGEPQWSTITGSGVTIGTPTSGDYSSGFFSSWTSSTLISDAFQAVNVLLVSCAPAKPEFLASSTLVPSGVPITYTAILSAGLNSSDWYEAGYTSGDTITTYHVGTGFSFATASPSNAFYIGMAGQPSGFGSLLHIVTHDNVNTTYSTYDLTTNTTGTSGSITVTALNTYNTIWELANAELTYIHSSGDDGFYAHQLQHNNSGDATLEAEFFRDSYSIANPNPSFSISPSATEISRTGKWLSGVEYYGAGSVIRVDFEAASGIFNRCYCPVRCGNISGAGAPSTNLQPSSPPTYNAAWNNVGVSNGQSITLSVVNQATAQSSGGAWTNDYLAVTLYKPTGASVSANAALALPVNTYGVTSTTTFESFYDESQRLLNGTSSPFDPTITPLANGYAQVRNGIARYPISSDYSGSPTFTGDQEYQRWFYKTSASTGSLTFANGFNPSSISPYGLGDLNLLIYLDGDGVWFDLSVQVGIALNASSQVRDGSSMAKAFGGLVSMTSSVIHWSTGRYTTGVSGSGNGGAYRFVAVFTDSAVSLTAITSG